MGLLFHGHLEEKASFTDFGGQSWRTGIDFAAVNSPHRCWFGFAFVVASRLKFDALPFFFVHEPGFKTERSVLQ
jgi:hypothetical protein